MFVKILLLLTVVPFLELALLIAIGQAIGFWPTLAIIIGTGLVGAALIRWQGLRIVSRIGADIRAGRVPTEALLSGLITLIGGVLLLTPGLITDVTGLLLLIPAIERRLHGPLKDRLARWFKRGHIHVNGRPLSKPGAVTEDGAGIEAPHEEPFIDC